MNQLLKRLATLAAIFLLAACGGPQAGEPAIDSEMAEMDHESEEMAGMSHGGSEMMDAMGDGLQVMELYGRAAPAVSETGAFYMLISNGTGEDEVLQSASIDICGTVELHEMMMDGDVMRMQEVDGGEIVIPAGKAVSLQPGGLHVMCIGKSGELVAGSTVPVTLAFKNTGSMTMDAEIRMIGEEGMHGDMDGMDMEAEE